MKKLLIITMVFATSLETVIGANSNKKAAAIQSKIMRFNAYLLGYGYLTDYEKQNIQEIYPKLSMELDELNKRTSKHPILPPIQLQLSKQNIPQNISQPPPAPATHATVSALQPQQRMPQEQQPIIEVLQPAEQQQPEAPQPQPLTVPIITEAPQPAARAAEQQQPEAPQPQPLTVPIITEAPQPAARAAEQQQPGAPQPQSLTVPIITEAPQPAARAAGQQQPRAPQPQSPFSKTTNWILKNKKITSSALVAAITVQWYLLYTQCPGDQTFFEWLWENKTNPKVLTVCGLTAAEVIGLILLIMTPAPQQH